MIEGAPLIPPDPPLVAGPARLRALEDRDVPFFVRALEDPGVADLAYAGQLASDHATVQRYVETFRESAEQGAGILLTIADERDEMAGLAMLFAFKVRNRDGELGFWMAPWGRGRGLGAAGVRLAVAWAMHEVGLERVHANTAPQNTGARALLERIGFALDGTLRGADRTAAGERRDLVSYCMLYTDPQAPPDPRNP